MNWTNTTGPSSKQDSHPSLPDNVVLTLTMGNESAVLNLVKDQNDNFEEIPVIEGTNEDVKIWHHSRDEVRFEMILIFIIALSWWRKFISILNLENLKNKLKFLN